MLKSNLYIQESIPMLVYIIPKRFPYTPLQISGQQSPCTYSITTQHSIYYTWKYNTW